MITLDYLQNTTHSTIPPSPNPNHPPHPFTPLHTLQPLPSTQTTLQIPPLTIKISILNSQLSTLQPASPTSENLSRAPQRPHSVQPSIATVQPTQSIGDFHKTRQDGEGMVERGTYSDIVTRNQEKTEYLG